MKLSLNGITCAHFINLLIMIQIKSYWMPVAGSLLFNSFIIKSIVISCHSSSDNDIVFYKLYFVCVECLFRWQLLHFLICLYTCLYILEVTVFSKNSGNTVHIRVAKLWRVMMPFYIIINFLFTDNPLAISLYNRI